LYFYGIVHPPGLDERTAEHSLTDEMLKRQVDELVLDDYPITEGHPPGTDSVVKHANLVRGRIISQYKDSAGNKCVFGKVSMDDARGMRLYQRMMSGENCSLSLGHRIQLLEDKNKNVFRRFLGDHIAIVDEPRRPGCHLQGFVSADKIDTEHITILTEQLFGKSDGTSPEANASNEPVIASIMDAQSMQTQALPAGAAPGGGLPAPGQQQPAVPTDASGQTPAGEPQINPQNMSMVDLMKVAAKAIEGEKAAKLELQQSMAKIAEQEKRAMDLKRKEMFDTVSVLKAIVDRDAARGDADALKLAEKLKGGPEALCGELYGAGTNVESMSTLMESVSCAAKVCQRQVQENDRMAAQILNERQRDFPQHAATVSQYASEMNKRPRLDSWGTNSFAPPVAPSYVPPPQTQASMIDIQRTISNYCTDGLMRDMASGKPESYLNPMQTALNTKTSSGRFAHVPS